MVLDAGFADETLATRFAAQARRHPDRLAVHADERTLTYRALAEAAGGVALAIAESEHVEPGGPVGVLVDHGVDAVIAIVGSLIAGCRYVPLDPSWPAQRLAVMAVDAGVTVLVTSRRHASLAAQVTAADNGDRSIIWLDDLEAVDVTDGLPIADRRPAGADVPAYLLYTSGSTGRPKAVVQTHRNVLHGVRNHIDNFGIGPGDRLSLVSSFGFDMAVTDLFAALLSGATAVPVDVRRFGLVHLVEALAQRGVTVYHSTPTLYRYLLDTLGPSGRLDAVRVVVLGGEAVVATDVARARRHFGADCIFVNGYGTTEASFVVQYHLPPEAPVDDGVVPIGYPLPGYDVALLDDAGREGDEGEITIRSRYLALGYHGDPELTARRFVGNGAGTRAYRTGDLGRRNPDGSLAYLGRLDRQVKLRGYRVEPGEIEAHLMASSSITRAVVVPVVPHASGTAEPELVAYVQPAPGLSIDDAAVQETLSQQLPDHLVPRTVVSVPRLPLTITGKVDVRALPEPPRAETRDGAGPAPSNRFESTVAAAWRAELGCPTIGLDDDFFALGGHSLLLAQVQQRLEEDTGVRVPLLELFEHRTLRAMARVVERRAGVDDGACPDQAPDDATAARRLALVAERSARRRAARSSRETGS